EQLARIGVAALAAGSRALFAATGMLSGHQSEPGGELPRTAEASGVAHARDDGRGRDRADAADRLQAPAGLAGAMPAQQLSLDLSHTRRGVTQCLTKQGKQQTR